MECVSADACSPPQSLYLSPLALTNMFDMGRSVTTASSPRHREMRVFPLSPHKYEHVFPGERHSSHENRLRRIACPVHFVDFWRRNRAEQNSVPPDFPVHSSERPGRDGSNCSR